MAIEAKFGDEEIKAISASNLNEIVLKQYKWKASFEKTEGYDDAMEILENRMAEIRQSYDSKLEAEQAELEQEWISVVVHKDKHLRQKIQDENDQIKSQHIQELYKSLKALGTFTFPDEKDVIFRRNLAKMFHQVEKYCNRNNINITSELQVDVNKDNLKILEQPVIPSVPLPPPPPPPPPPPQQLFKPKSKTQTPKTLKVQRNLKISSTSSKPNEERTPLCSLNTELLRSIKRGKALELKRTPCKRSPGGTPMKRTRRLSESDTSDLITIALMRKFRNVNSISSPKENLSPNVAASPMSPSYEYP